MKEKQFNINEEGCSVRCKAYLNDPRSAGRVVLFGHGFGGHKDNRAAERFALKYLSKYKDAAVITFDWPCHGEDGRKRLSLEDCDQYIRLLLSYIEKQYAPKKIFGYATSFGGYLFLKYTHEHGLPFARMALRCPAVCMYDALTQGIMTQGDHELLEKESPSWWASTARSGSTGNSWRSCTRRTSRNGTLPTGRTTSSFSTA